jgi:hypothetical protein
VVKTVDKAAGVPCFAIAFENLHDAARAHGVQLACAQPVWHNHVWHTTSQCCKRLQLLFVQNSAHVQ